MSAYPRTIYFPADDSRVVIDQPLTGWYTAHLVDDVDEEDGRVRIYGAGPSVLSAIADLNNELEQVQ
jgi:hypothetical protein